MHPDAAALVRVWAFSIGDSLSCGPSTVKAFSPGMGRVDDDVIAAVEDAARLLGLEPVGHGNKATPLGYIRLPSSMRSLGKVGARKRYYMKRWTIDIATT